MGSILRWLAGATKSGAEEGPAPLRFDKQRLLADLNRLPVELRVAFACACAQELMPCYVAYCAKLETGEAEARYLVTALEQLWDDLVDPKMDTGTVAQMAERALALVPQDDFAWSLGVPYAMEAAAAATYALQTRCKGDSQAAVWAAQCVYNVLDAYVIHVALGDPQILDRAAQATVLVHPLIQGLFARQAKLIQRFREADKADIPSIIGDIRRKTADNPAIPAD